MSMKIGGTTGLEFPDASIQPSASRVFKNKFFNGEFTRWSWGEGPFSASGWIADLSYVSKGAGSTQTWKKGSLIDPISKGSVPCIEWDLTAIGTSNTDLRFYAEGVERYSGKTMTFSFKASCESGTVPIRVYMSQVFGSGGSPSTAVNTGANVKTVTTEEQTFSATWAVPTLEGKTLGTDNNDSFRVAIRRSNLDANPNGKIFIRDLQIEEGAAPTVFEPIPIQDTIRACKRFYQVLGKDANGEWGIYGYTGSAGGYIAAVSTLPVEMRAAPTVTVIGTFNAVNVGQPLIGNITKNNVTISATSTVAGNCSIVSVKDSAYFTLDASLQP